MSKKEDIICENTWKTVKHQTNYCDCFKEIETKFSNIFSDRGKKKNIQLHIAHFLSLLPHQF